MRRPESRIALSAICLAGFLMQLDVTIVNVALPSIQRGLSDERCKWRFPCQRSSAAGMRSAKVMAKAFSAGFHLIVHLV